MNDWMQLHMYTGAQTAMYLLIVDILSTSYSKINLKNVYLPNKYDISYLLNNMTTFHPFHEGESNE